MSNETTTTTMIASLKARLAECAVYKQEIAAEERAVKKAIKALEAIEGAEETEQQETEAEPQADNVLCSKPDAETEMYA